MQAIVTEPTRFLGKHGVLRCVGFRLEKRKTHDGIVIRITPTTPNSEPGQCALEVPLDDVGRFLIALKQECDFRSYFPICNNHLPVEPEPLKLLKRHRLARNPCDHCDNTDPGLCLSCEKKEAEDDDRREEICIG